MTNKTSVPCPSMSDLADPATVLAVVVAERVSKAREFLASGPDLTKRREVATRLFAASGTALLDALKAFCEACDAVEEAT